MGFFGKQTHYCPNCGKKLYDDNLADRSRPLMCSMEYLDEWELKYARSILGKDEVQ